MQDQKSGPELACNQDFAKEKGLEPKVKKKFLILSVGRLGGQISLMQTYHRLGSEVRPLGDFYTFLGKNSFFMPFGTYIACF